RDDRRAALTAAAGGTLLLIDAWFDVCTSAPGTPELLALAEAAFAEVPLAVAAEARRCPARGDIPGYTSGGTPNATAAFKAAFGAGG
ncbi:MAG: hypothetical protein ACRDNS_01410, partial [Trebonia sp.]